MKPFLTELFGNRLCFAPMNIDDTTTEYAVGFLLRQAHQRASTAFAGALEPLGIAGRHFAVLHHLARTGPLSQRELVERIGSDKASMVRIVDDLEAEGMAHRGPTPGDRRTYSVAISDHGKATLAEAEKTARQVAAQLLSHLDSADRARLVALLAEFVAPAKIADRDGQVEVGET
jgi:DNA-binding MarR family transcriptional regulator